MKPEISQSTLSLLLGSDGTAQESLEPLTRPAVTASSAILELGASRQRRIRAANNLDLVKIVAGHFDDRHRQALVSDLQRLAHEEARSGVPELLEKLAVQRGMSWSNIARLVGVSVGAVRKWRKQGAATAENRFALGRLSAFLTLLDSYPIQDPGGWLEIPLVPGYDVTGIDIYRGKQEVSLLEFASNGISAESVLDNFDTDWRESRKSDHEVFEADDGMLAIRSRRKDG